MIQPGLVATVASQAALKEALAAEAGGVEALAARLRELGWAGGRAGCGAPGCGRVGLLAKGGWRWP